ncbi:MAG: PAS domain S-box protein [candidate division Zixibacteria bacterium]|nr:PAS domain S-box protein [candidate division Zixibacteria bacterium]
MNVVGRQEGAFLRSYNPALNIDNPANFTLISYPGMKTLDDDPVLLVVNDWQIYQDVLLKEKAVAGAGYRNDSVWAFRLQPEAEGLEKVYLTTGKDATGDGRWEPEIYVLLMEDYDFDGYHEAFFYVNSMRELTPRVLFCVEMETLKIEWFLPVATLLNRRNFHSLRDSLNPGVIFTAYNPKQGVTDDNFSDLYGYLTIIGHSGNIISNRIIALDYGGTGIIPAESERNFYVVSELDLKSETVTDSSVLNRYYISKVDGTGRVLGSLAVPEKPYDMWLAPYGSEQRTGLFVHFYNSNVKVYAPDNFKLLAFSDTVALGAYLDRIKLDETEEDGFVFSDGIYSAELSRLAGFPFKAGDYQPLSLDAQGNVRTLIVNSKNRYFISRLKKKPWWLLISTLVARHQFYILVVLSFLTVSLIIANNLRRRAIEKVMESEERLNSVFENIDDVLYQTDLEGRLIWISPSVKKTLGYEVGEVVGRNIKDYYIHPGRRDELLEILKAQEQVKDFEVLIRHRDGREVVLSTNTHFFRDRKGEIIGTEGDARDITFRKKAEEKVRDAKNQLEQIFQAAAPLCVIDKNYNILGVNDTYSHLFKVTRHDEIGQKCYEKWPSKICHTERCPMQRILAGESRYVYELDNRLRDKTVVSTVVTAIPYLDADGKVQGIVENFSDITQRKIAEEALRLSEEKYRTLVESAEVAIFTINREGVFLYLNGVAAQMLGGKADDLTGKTMMELFPENIAHSQMDHVRRVFDSGEAETVESVTILKGRKHHFRTSIQPIRDENGGIISALGLASDTTRYVNTQQELKSEREFVGSLLETANSLVVCLDSRARITVFNGEIEKVSGYRREEVIGRRWPDIFLPPDHNARKIDDFAAWVRQHPEDKYEGPLITRTGEVRTILWSNSALFSEGSDELRAIAVGHDITERKKAEQALIESEEKFREIAELAPEGIFETDIDGKLIFANQQALSYFGYSKDDLGKGLSALDMIAPESRKRAGANYEQLISGGEIGTNEYTAIRKDGSLFPITLHSNAIVRQGRAVGVRGVIVDITERKRNEEMQMVLYKITNAVNVTKDLNELFKLIRNILGSIIDTSNFFIALYDKATDSIYSPYSVDEKDNFSPFPAGKTMTSYVIKNDRPLLADAEVKRRMVEAGEIRTVGTPSKIWLGVPLKSGNTVIGAVVVQNYHEKKTYTEKDLEVLKFVSEHIAIALERKKAEEALSESEHRYTLATTAAKVGVWDRNLETGEFYLDPAVKANLGYADHEIPNNLDYWLDMIYADDKETVNKAFEDNINGKTQELQFEHRMYHRDGSIVWMMVRGKAIRNPDGKVVRILGTNTVITELKKGEEALRESEARFSEALKNSRDVLYRMNLKTMTYDYISQSVVNMTGYTPGEVITRGVQGMREMTHPDDLKKIGTHRQDLVNSLKNEPIASNTEYRLKCKDGKYRWLSDSHVLIRDDHGEPRFIIGSVRDITEQKRAAEALQKSEEKSRAQYKSIPLPTYTWQRVGDDFVLIDYNDRAVEVTDGKIVDFTGKKFTEMYPNWDEGMNDMWQCFNSRKSHKNEIKYKYMTTGKERILDVNYAFVPPDLVMVHTDDITERREAEAKMRASEQEKYEQAKRTAGVFAHEIRNALFPANVAISRIKNNEFGKTGDMRDLSYYAAVAEHSVMKAAEITRLISAYTKIDTEKMPQRVNLAEVVKELLSNNRLRIKDDNIHTVIKGEDNVWVRSNNKQLLLALNNMMLNSLDALSGQTKPEIRITWSKREKKVKLIFEDNGAGIPAGDLQRIFEPFFSTKAEVGGTGIGLAMARRIIEMYDGDIVVFSTPGRGTGFEIKLVADKG